MCGIFALFNETSSSGFNHEFITNQFHKGKNRGPENSKLITFDDSVKFGFHRLAINGLNSLSNQPIFLDNVVLICNGEIYNYKQLYKDLQIVPQTDSDCEVIIHLYKRFGIEDTLRLLDGVYAFVLYDMQIVEQKPTKIYVARDPLGIRPLYVLKPKAPLEHNSQCFFYGIASELKMLSGFYNYSPSIVENYELVNFTPGTYSVYEKSHVILSLWKETVSNKPHFKLVSNYTIVNDIIPDMDWIITGIQNHLYNAVKKRYINTERPIACLLSGGLDSSLITALVCNINKMYSTNSIETYSIGLKNSEDLFFAKKVATYLGTNHTEIIVTENDMLHAIPEVIYAIESYDTTTIRASIGNYLLGKYISQNSDAKVIFNGDGSDELCGGYLYMSKAPNVLEFDNETHRLLTDIHKFDVLRSDKCISSHGLEPRTPFLDKNFVQFYLSIPAYIRKSEQCEKYLLRQSFSPLHYLSEFLPDEILWRKKEAFSDGVSNQGRSLFTIIQEYVDRIVEDNTNIVTNINKPCTKEQIYYRNLFNSYYPNLETTLPYFWMPRFVQATDPSARTLSIYKDQQM